MKNIRKLVDFGEFQIYGLLISLKIVKAMILRTLHTKITIFVQKFFAQFFVLTF
jgi:hypothetical protein